VASRRSNLIVLVTDFGYRDPYVGVMKGVIKSINPGAEVIDLTHGISRHNILEAAVTLLVSARYFPPETIFVTVVDPGVGSERRAVVVETSNYILVGPDNGCLSLLALRDGVKRVFDVSNSKYRLGDVSYTFHGRDVFAPIAAWISLGIPLEEIGVEVDASSLERIVIEPPRLKEAGGVECSVLYIDVYGNVMTNVDREVLREAGFREGEQLYIVTPGGGKHKCTFVKSFSMVKPGELACYVNSWGFLEIAVFMGDASKTMNVSQGSRLTIAPASP